MSVVWPIYKFESIVVWLNRVLFSLGEPRVVGNKCQDHKPSRFRVQKPLVQLEFTDNMIFEKNSILQ